jgi:hypothetical protein
LKLFNKDHEWRRFKELQCFTLRVNLHQPYAEFSCWLQSFPGLSARREKKQEFAETVHSECPQHCDWGGIQVFHSGKN